MPVPALVVLGAIGLVAVLVAVLLTMERRRLAARDADMARDAAQRGWRYQAWRVRGRRTERWQGPSLTGSAPFGHGRGGPWTAEVVEQRRRKGPTLALAMALDVRFGPSASLSAFPLQRVDPERPIVDGYAVLSDDPPAATGRLTPGVVAAVRQALPPDVWGDGPIRRPWVSLAGDRVGVAGVSRREPRAVDVAALVQAGGLIAQQRG